LDLRAERGVNRQAGDQDHRSAIGVGPGQDTACEGKAGFGFEHADGGKAGAPDQAARKLPGLIIGIADGFDRFFHRWSISAPF
jgi:hypothetical protein